MDLEESKNNGIFIVNGVANHSFVKDSLTKVAIFCLFLSVFYPIGWFYKQWKEIKKNNESYKNISPFWRGVFYPIYIFPFTKIVNELLKAKKAEELKSENLEEKEKTDSEAEYKKLDGVTAAPYLILIAIAILVVLGFLFDINVRIGGTIFALVITSLSFLQSAINKILPEDHQRKETLSAADFLCIPFFGLFIFALLVASVFSALTCFEAEGNVLKNTCDNYSVTFPSNGEIFTPEPSKYFMYCQDNESKKESLCVVEGNFDKPEDFNMETLSKQHTPTNKVTKEYANNTTHCISETVEGEGYYNTCYMKIERETPVYLIFVRSAENSNIETLEALMNSYKDL